MTSLYIHTLLIVGAHKRFLLSWKNIYFYFFQNRVLLCSPGWPLTCDFPALPFQMLGFKVCTTITNREYAILKQASEY